MKNKAITASSAGADVQNVAPSARHISPRDPFKGRGGSYIMNPDTGERTRAPEPDHNNLKEAKVAT